MKKTQKLEKIAQKNELESLRQLALRSSVIPNIFENCHSI